MPADDMPSAALAAAAAPATSAPQGAWGKSAADVAADLLRKMRLPGTSSLYILPSTKLEEAGMLSIAEELRKNDTLRELYASGHRMQGAPMRVLAEVLREN